MKRYIKYIILITGSLFSLLEPVNAAEEILFVNGLFYRSIPIQKIEKLAKTSKAEGSIKNIIELGNQDPQKLSEILKEEFETPLSITSKLMYSSIGDVIIRRIAKIIHPFKIKDAAITVPAIRSAVIKGSLDGNGKLNLISFLKAYPNKKVAINIPALSRIINKVESMSDLVQFFSTSPLERIQKGNPKT